MHRGMHGAYKPGTHDTPDTPIQAKYPGTDVREKAHTGFEPVPPP